ncbi:SUKH-4 family immunity protein [Streptomyces sp. JL1001]|uniref:SUKH-4 family immunity protein n=1 Tax=Streptomyces sp. JL1001 TaxID=3078227 RepID=A0AAU8K9Q5_9ACTN
MKFVITADEVRSVFGLSGVVHFPRHDAPHNRLNDRAARLLSAVGLPDTSWFMSKASLRGDDVVDLVSSYGSRGAAPPACRRWLAFEEVIDGIW